MEVMDAANDMAGDDAASVLEAAVVARDDLAVHSGLTVSGGTEGFRPPEQRGSDIPTSRRGWATWSRRCHSAATRNVDRWVWLMPDGTAYVDAPQVRLRTRSPGTARITLLATPGSGERLEAIHDLRVTGS